MAFKKPDPRPAVNLPFSSLDQLMIIGGAIGTIISFGLVARYWPQLPQTIPTHFGPSGQPDGWGGRESILMLPVLEFVLYGMMVILSRFPQIYNYPVKITEENAAIQYQMARSLILYLGLFIPWLFTYIEWAIVRSALSGENILSAGFTLIIVLLSFVPIIYYVLQSLKLK